ncbi:MAG: FKBP-type peptidyl-prolyl cis-trans isomerase [Treponema sp.]|nr:FKBP-type peptidyl-prolyl cis-trans isomerase [Treponema sp.]
MKRTICGLLVFFAAVFFCTAENTYEEGGIEEMSYAFGMLVGADLAESGLEIDYEAFITGLLDMMESDATLFSIDEAMRVIDNAFEAAHAEMGLRNLVIGETFLAENGARPEVTTTPSGLQLEIISEGTGEMPGPTDTVLVHYEGTLLDGTVFDSTYGRGGGPVEIPLDMVIPGWAEGLRLMREGSMAKLFIPPDLAYGEWGAGSIGPNSVIIFDVELISISRYDLLPYD